MLNAQQAAAGSGWWAPANAAAVSAHPSESSRAVALHARQQQGPRGGIVPRGKMGPSCCTCSLLLRRSSSSVACCSAAPTKPPRAAASRASPAADSLPVTLGGPQLGAPDPGGAPPGERSIPYTCFRGRILTRLRAGTEGLRSSPGGCPSLKGNTAAKAAGLQSRGLQKGKMQRRCF